jgi:hypothetical protein
LPPTPITASNLQGQDFEYKFAVLQGYWRWKTRMDVSQATPQYSVRDVVSPFGLLRDNVPIPGPVVVAMAASITELQQQFAPLILNSPTTLTFTVDQGRGFSPPQTVTVTNNGVYGSLLSPVLTTSASYVVATPADLGGLPFNVPAQTAITVDSTNLLATSSPYAATVVVQDPTALNSPQTISLAIVVRPLANIAVSPAILTYYVTKPLTGPFPPIPSQYFVLSNTGPTASLLQYEIQKTCNFPWVASYNPVSGSIAGGSFQNVTVAVQPDFCMSTGTYTETLRISGYSDNYVATVQIQLIIS